MDSHITLRFKTNINCGGCIKSVTPFLDKVQGITNWSVDTDTVDKVLTVNLDGASGDDVQEAVKKAGFTIEPV